MSEIYLYDSLSNKKKKFEPIDQNHVRIYACGPTVYNYAHIGNARMAVVFDSFVRLLRNKYRNEKIINQTPDFNDNFQQPQYQSIQPRVTNYIAPRINIESSPTPSDSLERFKENKKFTIGQWVYGQYIQGFKQGNLYYRPIYDKGYNFSRRYLPDQNITSFLRPQKQYIENANRRESIPMDSNFQNLENLPIID